MFRQTKIIEERANNRNGAIDFLKFLACLVLLRHHYQLIFEFKRVEGLNFFGGSVYLGFLVELFFIISGYFTYSCVSKISNGQLKFKDFYLHKCVRMLPLVSFAGILYFFVNNYVFYGVYGEYYLARSNGMELVMTFLGIQIGWSNMYGCFLNPPMWYISSLLIAYVVLYFLISQSSKHKKNYVVLLISLIVVSIIGDLFGVYLPFFEDNARRAYIAVSVGVLLGAFLKKEFKKSSYIFALLACIFGVILYLLALKSGRELAEKYSLEFFLYPPLIMLATSPYAKRVFSWKLWGFLGAVSFDVYVLHYMIFLLIRCADHYWNMHLDFANYGLEFVILLIVLLVGMLSYLFVEKNLNKLAKKVVEFF